MLKNFLLISIRNLLRNRIYTAINIFGLGLALAICIVAYYNYIFDFTFDRQHENFRKIYRVSSFRDMDGREQEIGIIPAALAPQVKGEIPGLEYTTRIFRSRSPVKLGKELYNRLISYVDPEFFDIFTIQLIIGDASAISETNNVFISESLSNTLFGDEPAPGKSLAIINDDNEEYVYTISGVFTDPPDNSSFRHDIITHADNFMSMWKFDDSEWGRLANIMFVQLVPGTSPEGVIESLNNYIPMHNLAREDFKLTSFNLIPLKDVADSSREIWSSNLFPGLHPAATLAPPIMAIMILLIACFNFANTTIAAMSRRLREIGLRKTFGGFRKHLIAQFLFESLVICTLAILVGIAMARFLVPAYSSLWEYMTLTMSLGGHWHFILFLILLVLATGFLAGVYPAMYISRLRPVDILRSRAGFGKTSIISQVLLSLQFSISITALIMGVVFLNNSRYQQTLDMGYDRKELIVVPILPKDFQAYHEEIRNNPRIKMSAGTQQHINFGIYRRALKYQDMQAEVDVMNVGPDWPSTVGLRLTEGRLFDPDRVEADRNASVIINRQFARDFGMDMPIGETVSINDTTILTIIGVVEDYLVSSVWRAVEPAILMLTGDDTYYNLVVRTDPQNILEVKDYLLNKWQDMFPSYVFSGMYQEEAMEEEKNINSGIVKINLFLAVVATILSLIGIYSLVSLSVLRRTREIGIRNVMGSPLPGLIYLLGRRFIFLLLIASVLGSAGGYYLSAMLLDSIWDFFTEITPGMLLFSVALMFIITILTISGKTYSAATQNPVKAIQTE